MHAFRGCCGLCLGGEEDERKPIVSNEQLPAIPPGPTSVSLQLDTTVTEPPTPAEVPDFPQYSERAIEQDDMTKGKKLFNKHPRKGVAFLFEKGLLNETPEAVAAFLKEPFLDKRQIGEYLGTHQDFPRRALLLFTQSFDFAGLSFDVALRKYLDAFRLPGEAQKIDRIMETFATHYCQQNPGIFLSPDTAYILSFSLIMLNTDLHNPNVKNHMTKEAFIKNNRGINNGKDLPEDLLSQLYDSFKREELKMTQSLSYVDTSYTFFNPDREGYLWKLSSKGLTWQRRFFVVTGSVLYYFKSENDERTPSAIIPLENLAVREVELGSFAEADSRFAFELYDEAKTHKKNETIKAVKIYRGTLSKSTHKTFIFAAESRDERAEWIACIKANMAPPPIYSLRQLKKDKLVMQRSIDTVPATTPTSAPSSTSSSTALAAADAARVALLRSGSEGAVFPRLQSYVSGDNTSPPLSPAPSSAAAESPTPTSPVPPSLESQVEPLRSSASPAPDVLTQTLSSGGGSRDQVVAESVVTEQ